MSSTAPPQPNVSFVDQQPDSTVNTEEVLQGLRQPHKTLQPRWLYNQHGSQLFERITRLPEYYPTRTERGILQANAGEIGEHCADGCILVEPGSGNCAKVRLLLAALRPAAYVPVDISSDYLRQAALALGAEHPWLPVIAVCADFNHDWSFVETLPAGKRVVFYPGSTIGNLEPAAALRFLQQVGAVLGRDGGALIGVDLHKPEAILNAAYNDTAGFTAAFNRNALDHLNAVLGTDFDSSRFRHRAFYNRAARRVEMHLESLQAQQVQLRGERIDFRAGETIHTENSYKYTVGDFSALAASAGLSVARTWLDPEQLFSVHYLHAGPIGA